MEAEEISLEKSSDDGQLDKSIEIAQKMLSKDKNPEEVDELTGFSLEKINSLKVKSF